MNEPRPNWSLSRAECLAAQPFWHECTTCAERTDVEAWCRYCDGWIAPHYHQSGGIAEWQRFAHKSLASLDWAWLGQTVTGQLRAFADTLPQQVREGQGLYLGGRPGSGKTHAALGLGLIGLAHGFSVYATTLGGLLLEIRATFNRQGADDESALLERLCDLDLLILDDLGMEQATPWAVEKLAHLIHTRYARRKSLLVTSNFHPARLEVVWGPHLMSRVYATCELLSFADVDDYRPFERAESLGRAEPFLTHWPGTDAEVVVAK